MTEHSKPHRHCTHCMHHQPSPPPVTQPAPQPKRGCELVERNRDLETVLVRARHESSCWQIQLANTRTELHRAEAVIEHLRAKLAAAHRLTHDLESVTRFGGAHG